MMVPIGLAMIYQISDMMEKENLMSQNQMTYFY